MLPLFYQRELLVGTSVSLSLCPFFTDGKTVISLYKTELLIGSSVIMSLSASRYNSNMIGLEYFIPTMLWHKLNVGEDAATLSSTIR